MTTVPRLWVPGVCVVGDAGVLHMGPLVGWRFPRGIDDWKAEVVAFATDRDDEHYPLHMPAQTVFTVHPNPTGWAELGVHLPLAQVIRSSTARRLGSLLWILALVATVLFALYRAS